MCNVIYVLLAGRWRKLKRRSLLWRFLALPCVVTAFFFDLSPFPSIFALCSKFALSQMVPSTHRRRKRERETESEQSKSCLPPPSPNSLLVNSQESGACTQDKFQMRKSFLFPSSLHLSSLSFKLKYNVFIIQCSKNHRPY